MAILRPSGENIRDESINFVDLMPEVQTTIEKANTALFTGDFIATLNPNNEALSEFAAGTDSARIIPLIVNYLKPISTVSFQLNNEALLLGESYDQHVEIAVYDFDGNRLTHLTLTSGLGSNGLKQFMLSSSIEIKPGCYFVSVFIRDSKIRMVSGKSLPLAGMVPNQGLMPINADAPYLPSTLNISDITEAVDPQPWLLFT